MDKIDQLKEIIKNSKHIIGFTGAGISVPSGIPDFRSANGLYNDKTFCNYAPEEIISHFFFLNNPEVFYKFYKEKMVYQEAKPNIAHKFFAKLEEEGKCLGVITQNIDGLHQMAGSKNVYELHGSIYRNHCTRCGKSYRLEELYDELVPHCSCGGIIKPDVVLYGEGLDEDVVTSAISAMMKADTLIVVGTSLTVYPAASYLYYFRGKNIIVINKSQVTLNMDNVLYFNEDVEKVIKELEK